MYIAELRWKIEKELKQYPEIEKKLGKYKNQFIKWCATQRYHYEPDLKSELQEFKERYFKDRLYHSDLKLWKEISKKVFERDNFTCTYCGAKNGFLEVDHIIPISRGGTNDMSNLTTACRTCNRQKKDKTPEEFKVWRGKQMKKRGEKNG